MNYFIFLRNSSLIKRTMFFSLSERKKFFWIGFRDSLKTWLEHYYLLVRILKHFSMFTSTLSEVFLDKRHWEKTNLWNSIFYVEILLENAARFDKHLKRRTPLRCCCFYYCFSFWCEMSRITENSGSVDFIAGSDLLIFHENYLYFWRCLVLL